MASAILFAAIGGSALWLWYLLVHGETPAPVQRLSSTVPSKIRDTTKQPRVSGSGTSVMAAIASSGNDPSLIDRPAALGGDHSSTGHVVGKLSSKSMELPPPIPPDPELTEALRTGDNKDKKWKKLAKEARRAAKAQREFEDDFELLPP